MRFALQTDEATDTNKGCLLITYVKLEIFLSTKKEASQEKTLGTTGLKEGRKHEGSNQLFERPNKDRMDEGSLSVKLGKTSQQVGPLCKCQKGSVQIDVLMHVIT